MHFLRTLDVSECYDQSLVFSLNSFESKSQRRLKQKVGILLAANARRVEPECKCPCHNKVQHVCRYVGLTLRDAWRVDDEGFVQTNAHKKKNNNSEFGECGPTKHPQAKRENWLLTRRILSLIWADAPTNAIARFSQPQSKHRSHACAWVQPASNKRRAMTYTFFNRWLMKVYLWSYRWSLFGNAGDVGGLNKGATPLVKNNEREKSKKNAQTTKLHNFGLLRHACSCQCSLSKLKVRNFYSTPVYFNIETWYSSESKPSKSQTQACPTALFLSFLLLSHFFSWRCPFCFV